MTKVATKKPQTLKSARPTGKVAKPKAVKAQYFKAIDRMMASVEYARKGMPVRAAKALADAVNDPQIDQAMQYLNDQQDQLMDQGTDLDQEVVFDEQARVSQTLARLIRSSQTAEAAELAAEDDEQDEEDDEDDTEEQEEDEDEQSEESSTETAGEDDGDDEDGLDISMEDQDEEDDAQEQQVQASVASRLARAERNKARRA